MLADYGHVGFLLVMAILFPAGGIFTSWLLSRLRIRPQQPTSVKSDTYECGVLAEGNAWGQFHVRYYLFALIFLVFDIEALFLYPWAVSLGVLGVGGFIAAMVFVLTLVLGLVYDWRKGGLEWK